MALRMDFMSLESLSDKTIEKKIETILKKVEVGHMVVLDGVLEPDEEMRLVEATMKEVNDKFTGIEVCTLPRKQSKFMGAYGFVVEKLKRGRLVKSGLTLIGPSRVVKKIKRNPDSFYVLAEV